MKIVIVGGHLSPALAVIDALPKDAKILFIGRKHAFEGDKATSLEYSTIKSLKIPFATISTGRLQRKFTRYTIPSFFKIPYGFIQSFFILLDFKPDVVLSFGGYLSLPMGFSALFLGIPIVIHEQTLEAGAANKIIATFAKKVCISWESSRKFFPKEKIVLTGNPIRDFHLSTKIPFVNHMSLRGAKNERRRSPQRKEIASQASPDRNDKNNKRDNLQTGSKNLPMIYVTGGSSGSHFINTLVEGCITQLLEKFVVIHQTGDAQEYRDFDRLSSLRNSLFLKLKTRYFLVKFVDPYEVDTILKKADLVVGRSGVNTITELIFFRKPCLLIPLPYSQNNEQFKNALFLKGLGLAEVFYQDTLDSKKFLRFIEEMFNNIDRYKIRKLVQAFGSEVFDREAQTESAQARRDDRGRAAQKIVEVVYYEAKNKKK